jgi:hypothetical protein
MTEIEKYRGCLRSFFRNRHSARNRFRSGRKVGKILMSNHKRHCEMVRHYIAKIRTIQPKTITM